MVTGAAGQLGSIIVRAFRGGQVIAHTRDTLDITDTAAVRQAVASARPDAVINCAAFNDVDGAESQPLAALAGNAFAVRSLAQACEGAGAALVHYSSDFIFDGTATEPYVEEATPSPQGVYAASKLLGEWFALEAPRAYVLRVESLFGSPPGWTGRRGTLDAMVAGLCAGREIRAFVDRVVSPSYTPDIAAATRHLLESGAPPGVYHCVNAGQATWYEVAAETAHLLGVTPRIVPVRFDEVKLRARRPKFCALNPQKLAATGFQMPDWRDALARWLAERRA